jgi:drug/metabolite transporter (DMT)-like permease
VKDYAVFALLCFCWGSTFLPAKLALEVVPPVFLAGVRFVLASSILFLWLIIAKQKVTARAALKILLSSLFTITFAFGLLFWGIQHLPSGLSGVISFAGVAVSLPVLSVVVKQEVFSVKRFSGVLLG